MPSGPARIHVVHSTAPGCSWSWGYEAVMNRLRMVYGDQIELTLRLGCPYESWSEWLVEYGMSEDEALEWMNGEVAERMGVPLARLEKGRIPQNVLPATLATVAAFRQGSEKGWRFNRALLRAYAVEGKDPANFDVALAAAREAGLDEARFRKDAEDERIVDEYGELAQSGPPVHAGFYNVVVWDGGERRVMLEYAFDPALVEGAIDYLSGGKLQKAKPTDVHAYLRQHGFAPALEIARVFALTPAQATAELERLEKAGKAERALLAGAPHWTSTTSS